MVSHRVTCHSAPGRGSVFRPYPSRYSICPAVKDDRLSRPASAQVNDLPRVATEVPAIAGVGWLSRPAAPLGTVVVNNLPAVVIRSDRLQRDSNPFSAA